MLKLPPWISLRGLAVELCPPGRELNSFKRELLTILDGERVKRVRFRGYSRKGRYIVKHLPGWVTDAWINVRKSRIS